MHELIIPKFIKQFNLLQTNFHRLTKLYCFYNYHKSYWLKCYGHAWNTDGQLIKEVLINKTKTTIKKIQNLIDKNL